MIKDNQQTFNRLHVLADALMIIIAYMAAYSLRFVLLGMQKAGNYDFQWYLQFLIALVPSYLVIYKLCGLYNPKRARSFRREIWNLILANFFGVGSFIIMLYVFKGDISRWFIAFFFGSNVFSCGMYRLLVRISLEKIRSKGKNLKHMLIVGYSRAAEGYIDRVLGNPQWGYYIHGILDDRMAVGTKYRKIEVIGTLAELPKHLAGNKYDEIAVALSINDYGMLEELVTKCEYSGVHTKFIPDYNNIIPTVPYIEDLDGLPVINIRKNPLTNVINRFLKRVGDILGALLCLVIFSIPMLIVALIIKITSDGPVIFSQVRVGLHNREFKMYKFRSMVVQESSQEANAWTTKNDVRVTGIGKFIRKTSIDELPQLFNVLKGDMSLIGPRPERPQFVEKFKEEIPRYMVKHQVRPGMTGWAQVNGYRGDTSIRRRIDCDLYYIENWSIGLDIMILFLTVFKGFVNKNAY